MSQVGRMWEVFFGLFFAAVIASIVFVSAGRRGGRSGGQQTADIINASGTSLSGVANSLEQA